MSPRSGDRYRFKTRKRNSHIRGQRTVFPRQLLLSVHSSLELQTEVNFKTENKVAETLSIRGKGATIG